MRFKHTWFCSRIPVGSLVIFWGIIFSIFVCIRIWAQSKETDRLILNDFRVEDWVASAEEREWSLQQRRRLRGKQVSTLWNEEKLSVRTDVMLSKEKKRKATPDSVGDD